MVYPPYVPHQMVHMGDVYHVASWYYMNVEQHHKQTNGWMMMDKNTPIACYIDGTPLYGDYIVYHMVSMEIDVASCVSHTYNDMVDYIQSCDGDDDDDATNPNQCDPLCDGGEMHVYVCMDDAPLPIVTYMH